METIDSINFGAFHHWMRSAGEFLKSKLNVILLVYGLMMSGTVFSQTATQIAANMGVAWNLGNTLEATCGEGCWSPAATQELIDAVAAAGFNTIRIPVSWDIHATNNQIDPAWLARVQEVVDYCYANNLYVIINIHWDNGWFDSNGFSSFNSQLNTKYQAYWTQIANQFINYDTHLLFCAANEPDIESASETAVLLQYYQTFVDAVRTTGGQNTFRSLVLPGPSTNIDKTNNWMNSLPNDPTPDRLMVDVHYYDPYNFTLMPADESWGLMSYYWGSGYHSTVNTDRNSTWGEEDWADDQFGLMQTKFINNGIPVLIGEFSAGKRSGIPELDLHLASRTYYHSYITQSIQNHGLVPMYWDNGVNFQVALFDRNTAQVIDPDNLSVLFGGEPLPRPSSDPTTVHVQSISTGTQSAGQGNKRGTATVTIHSNLENPVGSAMVSGTFSGTFNETVSGTTDSNGTVSFVTSGTAKGKLTVNFCVDNVTHSSLTYAPAQNDITCTGSGARLSENEATKMEDMMHLELYPNPAEKGIFYLSIPGKDDNVSIMIFDVQGKLVYKQFETEKEQVVVNSNLGKGLYIVKVQSEKTTLTHKLVVQ